MDKQSTSLDWVTRAKARGYGNIICLLLDTIEPIAPIVAQGLWVIQPISGLWNGTHTLQTLAQMLESPEGIEHLRQHLSDETQE